MLFALLLSVFQAFAAQTQAPDQIKNLAGCFAVSYRFVEDGAHDKEIKGSFEEILFESRADGSFFLQHFGILDQEKNKHFAEVWQPTADGKWQQTILSPNGTFRYSCVSPFDFNQFKCAVHNAPKPNRDRDRSDYETLDRDMILQITPKGWTQMETNIKRDSTGRAVSNELGWIEYRRTAPENCLGN